MKKAQGQIEVQEKVESKEVPAEKLKQIKDIALLGKLEETFELFGHEFTIHVLTERELIEAHSRSALFEGSRAGDMAFRWQCISSAIDLVDGKPLYQPLTADEDVAARKAEVTQRWITAVIDELYKKYIELNKKSIEILESAKNS